MRELKYKIDESIVNPIQALAVETESRQSLIAFMLMHDMVNNINFEKYQDEYKHYFAQYEAAKRKFQKEVINPILQTHNINEKFASWSLNFDEHEVTISVTE